MPCSARRTVVRPFSLLCFLIFLFFFIPATDFGWRLTYPWTETAADRGIPLWTA